MNKLQTTLRNFRFDNIHRKATDNITWFKLVIGEDKHTYSSECFNTDELKLLINYVASNSINFAPNTQNSFMCSDSEIYPYCGRMSLVPPKIRLAFPNNLILKKIPELSTTGQIYRCMDIELLNENGQSNHNYNLDFDIIGRIENL